MPLEGLDKIVAKGQILLDEHEPVETHSEFNYWVNEVTDWLTTKFPDSGLSAEWAAQGDSNLVVGGSYYDDPSSWSIFRMRVQSRLRWLGSLPLKIKISNLSAPAKAQNEAKQSGRKEIKIQTVSRAYVDPDRINELKALSNKKYDLSKLVRLCEEMNINFAGECYLSIIMVTRAILDHIPPILNCSKFSEVANNYSGAKSFKESMQHLENSSRKIADYYLHSQIRSSESLPNVTQIDFSNDLDFLLSEIIRVIKK
ncbi:hypothetical protein UWK_00854 [Desulfocapsa sulfexigens DSM 10523]|uniref:Uncharacterized protein n=1 Tax=Desulfocapsa sulfexigens (strain DSM 10523 / SB164P1) TaxID=1167006 RepID=M1P1R0_DESSD|nr:hypothetical protein [Desulfocapsa sulfexigens]AGF77428.1 hypothetical protein UWK_00854 [Desulfocapsa sulfexigens DSM 10523]